MARKASGADAPTPTRTISASELGWLLRQVRTRYEDEAVTAIGSEPGGLRGFQLLSSAIDTCPKSQIELGRRLGIDRNAMVYLVDELEEAGWVERKPDPADRRNKSVSVTPAGAKAHRDLCARLDEATLDLFEPLSANERAQLAELLGRLVEHAVANCEE